MVKRPPTRRENIDRPESIHGDKGKFAFLAKAEVGWTGRLSFAPALPSFPVSHPTPPLHTTTKLETVVGKTASAPAPAPAAEADADVYVTACAFEKMDDSGISFKEGQTAKVLERADTGWR